MFKKLRKWFVWLYAPVLVGWFYLIGPLLLFLSTPGGVVSAGSLMAVMALYALVSAVTGFMTMAQYFASDRYLRRHADIKLFSKPAFFSSAVVLVYFLTQPSWLGLALLVLALIGALVGISTHFFATLDLRNWLSVPPIWIDWWWTIHKYPLSSWFFWFVGSMLLVLVAVMKFAPMYIGLMVLPLPLLGILMAIMAGVYMEILEGWHRKLIVFAATYSWLWIFFTINGPFWEWWLMVLFLIETALSYGWSAGNMKKQHPVINQLNWLGIDLKGLKTFD